MADVEGFDPAAAAVAPDVVEDKWWSDKTNAVVTGAGKGIGLEIVKALASEGITVILTLRSEEAAKSLAEKLESESGFKVRYHGLDITSPASVEAFAAWTRDEFKGIDILVNNAGLYLHPDKHDLEEALPVIEVNYYGTKRLTEALLPFMNEGARIVNLSTIGSRLDTLHNEWQQKLWDEDSLTEATVEGFVSAYLDDVREGKQFGKGWAEEFGRMDYCIAKMAINAYTRLLASKLWSEGRKIFVNCTSPGHTSCVMSGHTGHSAAEGALTAVWLALVPPSQGVSGKYFVRNKDVGYFSIPLAHFDSLIYDVKDIKQHLHERANYIPKKQ